MKRSDEWREAEPEVRCPRSEVIKSRDKWPLDGRMACSVASDKKRQNGERAAEEKR